MIPRPTFYTLEDLQEPAERGGWGLTHDALMVLVEDGQLTTTLKTIRGEVREGITAEERERAEREAKGKPERELRADRVRNYGELIGVLLARYYGNDPAALEHYAVAGDLEQFAATARIPLTAGTKTLALMVRDGADFL